MYGVNHSWSERAELDRSSSWTDGPFAAQPVGCREHSGSGAGAKLLRYRNLADSSRNVPAILAPTCHLHTARQNRLGVHLGGRNFYAPLTVRLFGRRSFLALTAISERGTAISTRGTPPAAVVTRPAGAETRRSFIRGPRPLCCAGAQSVLNASPDRITEPWPVSWQGSGFAVAIERDCAYPGCFAAVGKVSMPAGRLIASS